MGKTTSIRIVVRLPGADVEIVPPNGHLPLHKHKGRELSIDDLRIFYTCINHIKRDDGRPLSDEELIGIISIRLGMPIGWIPVAVADLRNPKSKWSIQIAKTVAWEEWLMELKLRAAVLYQEWTDRIKAAADAQRTKLNLKNMRLPRLTTRSGALKTLSEDELEEIYAGMCWYEYEGKTLETSELRTLSSLLAGLEEPFRNIPKWLNNFIKGADDPFTVEVRRVATFKKYFLLQKVHAVWRNYLHPELPRGYDMAKTMWSQQSVSTSGLVVTENLAQEQQPFQPPIPPGYASFGSAYRPVDLQLVAGGLGTISHPLHSSRPAQHGPPIPPGYTNVGSAYGPADLRPVGESLGTISHPSFQFSNPEYEQDFMTGQLPQSFQAQFQHAGLHEQQTPVNRANLASSEAKTPISSSSGRSASPTRAGTARQQEDEKARRKTANDDSKKKADEDDGKKARDSRQKKADKAKEQAKKGRRQ